MSSIQAYNYAGSSAPDFELHEWASPEEIARYGCKRETEGVILAEGVNIAPHYRVRDFLWAINNNVFCVGGSGAGKTYSFILPNILNHQAQNYVITDTKGEISKQVVAGLEQDGYEVKILDTISLAHSDHYDPLRYVKTQEDIVVIAERLYYSVRTAGREGTLNSRADPFWDESGALLLRALIGILFDLERKDGAFAPSAPKGAPHKHLTMKKLLKLTKMLCISESNNGEGNAPLDYLMRGVAEGGIDGPLFEAMPGSYGIEQYNDFRVAADRTLKSILISLNASLTKLRGEEFDRLFTGDDMQFEKIGEGKRVVILKMSDCDSSKSFLAQIALQQLIEQAFKAADASENGKLKRPVQFILDEFPNVGRIPDFPRVIATARSRGISFLICAQSTSQIESLYREQSKVIYDNCDTFLYMGSGSSLDTAEYISRLCGTSKVGTQLCGIERTERAVEGVVITPSDLRLLPRTDCIVLISGCRPYRAKKYDCKKHPNAKKFLKALS